jgi:cardiolipin synthase
MVVDDQWVSIGSVNLDNASLALNNELNVTFMDPRLVRMLSGIFEDDLRSTTPVTLEEWQSHVLRHLLYLPLIPLRDQM